MINTKKYPKIDILFPYVDCDDIEWQKLYYENLKEYKNLNITWDDWATGMKRFRPNGMLKYVFRGIEKNCPWVNKVHMIVQSESQIPDWVNRETVNIVYHKDFIPEEYLPTFNSSTIEMFIHNIKDLSEYFVYGNDDTIFTSLININDFFKFNDKGKLLKLVCGVKLAKTNPNFIGDILRSSNHRVLTNRYKNFVYRFQHTYMPYSKSIIKEVFNKYKNEIYSNVSPFRNMKEHNQWLFSEYAYLNKMISNKTLPNFCTEIKDKTIDKILIKNFSKYKSVCLNDHESTTEEQINKVLNKFNKLFPNKCKYEL